MKRLPEEKRSKAVLQELYNPSIVDIGDRAKAIAKALYLDNDRIAVARKREMASQFQLWRA